MKNKFFLMVVAGTLLFTMSCNQAVNLDQILKDDSTRQEVFTKIAADHEMMTDFMEVMMKDNHAKMMIKGHEGMKEMMMGEGGMMDMMNDKPDMMHNMMSEMMKDKKMMGNMMKMMNQEGMMSEECMQSCMKMMGDKEMDTGSMKDNGNGNNHESHNH